MTRVASLFLPLLPIERLRRTERSHAPPEPARPPVLPVGDDPGACSVPRGGGWRPGARWARSDVAATAASLPAHQRPTMRQLGRRSEAAQHPFIGARGEEGRRPASTVAVEAAPVGRPLVLVAPVARREVVAAACPAALALGLHPGMAAAQARALVADLDVLPADPDADAALLDRLAVHAVRHWTPTAAPSGPDGLWLDLSGVTHLFGGEERFCRRVVRFLGRLGVTASIAVAGTPGAAHAVARHGGRRIAVVPAGGEGEAVADLPLACLRLDADALSAARRFGLERVADLLPMPRGPLARRLGLATVTRLDQALGREAEPITGVTPFEPPVAERRLLEPIATAEPIAQVIADLVRDLVELLRERGLGARSLALSLGRVDGADQNVTVGTARATRDGAHLVRLLGLRIDRVDPGLGVETMRLTATRVEPLGAVEVAPMLGGDDRPTDVAPLVDQLAGRVGGAAVFKVAPVESDVPERAVVRTGPLDTAGRWPAWSRPARVLARPEPLTGVIALLPDHPPRRFVWRGVPHVVVSGDGPERVHGEWWRRDGEVNAVRDYYRVEDEAGGRLWIFRRGDGVDPATGDLSWWMHGAFG